LIAPVSFGLGDLVVSLPPIQGAIRDGRDSGTEVWLVARSSGQAALAERIAGLAGIVEADLDLGPFDELIDLRNHPLQTDHWWGSPEFEASHGDLTINEIVSRIAADLGTPADVSRPEPLTAQPRPDAEGWVLFVADADGTTKRWPWARWGDLARALARRGRRSAVVTRGDRTHPLLEIGLPEIVAASPGEAVDVLSSCLAVVGVDTGLTHIAAQQRTPTVTLSRTPAVYFRRWPHTALVLGDSCAADCRAAEVAYAYNERVALGADQPAPRNCPVGSLCLAPITPDAVVGALEGLL
jgi:hypothetical protein